MRIEMIHGPNLNLLGNREIDLYGLETQKDLVEIVRNALGKRGKLNFFQSNSEGDLINYIQSLPEKSATILNAGAYTHTSLAIRDALLARDSQVIEVHISNIFAREKLRHQSKISDIAIGVISGLGYHGYLAALEVLIKLNNET